MNERRVARVTILRVPPSKPGLLGWGLWWAGAAALLRANHTFALDLKVKITTQPNEGWMGHPVVLELIKIRRIQLVSHELLTRLFH